MKLLKTIENKFKNNSLYKIKINNQIFINKNDVN